MAGTGLASHTAAAVQGFSEGLVCASRVVMLQPPCGLACALLVVIAPLQHLQQLANVHLGWCRQRSGNMPGSVSVP